MPINDNAKPVAYSQQIKEARVYLLEVLQQQLDELLVNELDPQPAEKGVPFINFQYDVPQVAAIKKVINSLYHAEEALRNYENVDASTLSGKVKAVPSLAKALIQLYKSISLLNDATPEIRAVIIQNYYIIEPIYTRAYEVIQESGWVEEFSEMEATEKASKVISQGISLMGSDWSKWNQSNPLLETFDKIAKLMETVTKVQDKELDPSGKKDSIELVRSLLDDLEHNAFLGQISIADLEDSKAVQDLFSWFKQIQEDGLDFTRNSITQYLSWTNYYLPRFLTLADQLERQNYLKPGTLTKELCSSADNLAAEMNTMLAADSTFQISERVATTSSLRAVREQAIEEQQVEHVKSIRAARQQSVASREFFAILRKYAGKSLADIVEEDRASLRKVYPKLQMMLAHADLDLENKLTDILNTPGSKEVPVVPESRWQKVRDAIWYVASFAMSAEIDKALKTESYIDETIDAQIEAEQFKITIAEKARSQLNPQADPSKSLQLQVAKRIKHIENELNEKGPEQEPVVPPLFVAVKLSELSSLRGALAYLQSKKLSLKVHDLGIALDTLVERHIANDKVNNLTKPHIVVDSQSEAAQQIKKIQKNTILLEQTLENFENLHFGLGITSHFTSYQALNQAQSIGETAYKLQKSLALLAPDAQQILTPVLEQLMSYGFTLSRMSSASSDVTAMEHLDGLKAPVVPPLTEQPIERNQSYPGEANVIHTVPGGPSEQSKSVSPEASTIPGKQDNTPEPNQTVNPVVNANADKKDTSLEQVQQVNTGDKQDAPIKSDPALDYVKILAAARLSLLTQLKSRLTLPLSAGLIPQKEGIPFVDIDNDPPQIGAIKKMINSMYHAEVAITTWKGIDTTTTLGKIAAVHQGVAALSQVYKSFEAFTTATPEVQNLLRENHHLIQPVLDGAKDLIRREGWSKQFDALDVTQKAGSVLGLALASVQSDSEQSTQTASLVKLLSQLPAMLNNISGMLDVHTEVSVKKLKLSQERIDSISALLELVFEENASLFNLLKGPQAILSLMELNKRFQRETGRLQEASIRSYQQWLNEYYSELLIMLDDIETRYYIKPGTLSLPVIAEIDRVNDKLNEVIESKPEGDLKNIHLSFDIAEHRKRAFDSRKTALWHDVFAVEGEQKAAQIFFDTLRKYSHSSFAAISPADRDKLRHDFALIQHALANCNLELANGVIKALDQTENPHISIAKVLKQETQVQHYLTQRHKANELKIRVIDEAVHHLKITNPDLASLKSEEISVEALRHDYLLAQASKPVNSAAELKPVGASSLNNIRGNIAFLQDLRLSSVVNIMKEQCTQLTKDKFSRRVQDYLKKPVEQSLYVVHDNDPVVVNQIKRVENGLYHLHRALSHFEQIQKSDGLVSQARALIEMKHEAGQLNETLKDLTPELKQHYGPIVEKMVAFVNKVQEIEYNKEDLQDFVLVLQTTKTELLKRKKPGKTDTGTAFFDAPAVTNISPGMKATNLGIKYVHLASPQLEKAREYLQGRYGKVFGKQPVFVKTYTRSHLKDENLMQSEISRLQLIFQNDYGFNLTTIRAIGDLIKQVQRVGAQASELADMVNTLVTDDYALIKEHAYKEIIAQLSEEEDYLCLQPGALLNPAMALLNQLFLSAALELDMPFENKLAILEDEKFLNVVITQTEKSLKELYAAQAADPSNKDIAFKIGLKEDKLTFLKEQVALMAEIDSNATKAALLDMQFEVCLREQLKATNIKKPIIDQYEIVLREYYVKEKNAFLLAEDSVAAVTQAMQEFETQTIGNYLIVYEAYRMLNKFSSKLPSKLPSKNKDLKDTNEDLKDPNKKLKDFIGGICEKICAEHVPIEKRASIVKSLPYDKSFVEKLSMADEGTHFLTKFKQFLERVISSIIEGLSGKGNIVRLYQQKKLEHAMQNIEETLKIKDTLKAMKEQDPEADLSQEDQEDHEASAQFVNNPAQNDGAEVVVEEEAEEEERRFQPF